MIMQKFIILILGLNLLLLIACGAKGPLYLPDHQPEKTADTATSIKPLADNPIN